MFSLLVVSMACLYGEIRFSRVRFPLRLERPGSGDYIYFYYWLHVVSFYFLFPTCWNMFVSIMVINYVQGFQIYLYVVKMNASI